MTDAPQDDKRSFSRILFDGRAIVSDGRISHTVGVLDLSLKGALLARPADWSPAIDSACDVEVLLAGGEVTIRMDARVAHVEPDRIGVACRHIDVDSISNLRRLVELNLGDPALLERQLSALG